MKKRIQEDGEFAKKFFKNLSRKSQGEKRLEGFIRFCKFPFRYTGDGGFVRKGICADFANDDDTQIIEYTGNQLKAWGGDYARYKKERKEAWNERGAIELLFIKDIELEDLTALSEKISKFAKVT